MALKKYKLGDLLTVSDEKNINNKYTVSDVKGISNQKMFIETKADMTGVSLTPYLLVKPDFFAYVPTTSRNGNKITIAYNSTSNTYIVSSSYIIFYVKDKSILLSDYLFMYFNRPEFDRYARFNSWGSARETFDWSEMCDIDIELPSIEIQQKYVNVYKAMVANQKAYENGLDDLKLVCDAIFTKYNKDNLLPIKELITISNKKNTENKLNRKNLRGINEFGEFTTTRDGIKDEKLSDYLMIPQNSFAVNFMCLGNFGKFYLALNESDMDYIVSPACQSFTVSEKLNPNYFRYVITRSEFQRRCVFYGDGNTRGGINISDFGEIEIAVPPIEVQKGIATIFAEYDNRRKINNKLKEKIKDLCPILIAGAINEAKKEV